MEGDGGAPGVEGHLWPLLKCTEVSSTENDLDPNADDDVKVEKPILNHAVKSTVLLVLNSCSQTSLPLPCLGQGPWRRWIPRQKYTCNSVFSRHSPALWGCIRARISVAPTETVGVSGTPRRREGRRRWGLPDLEEGIAARLGHWGGAAVT